MRYLRKDLVKESGTNLMVHKRENDGRWNIRDHPQNHVITKPEVVALPWSRPETHQFDWNDYLQLPTGEPLHDSNGIILEVDI